MSTETQDIETHQEFVGEYIRLIFQKPVGNWGIHLIADGDGNPIKVTGETDEIFRPGMLVSVYGEMEHDNAYGPTFKASSMMTYVPDAEASHEVFASWLRSGVIKHLGIVRANAVLERFGEETRAALGNPELLLQVNGIGPLLAPEIAADWNMKSADYRLAGMLHGLGLRGGEIRQVIRYYQENHAQKPDLDVDKFGSYILQNPYRLTEVQGIGFHRADAIAERMSVTEDSPFRMRAALVYSIAKLCEEQGHTLLAADWILDYACGDMVLAGNYYDLLEPELNSLTHGDKPDAVELAPGYYAPMNYYKAESIIWDRLASSQEDTGVVTPQDLERTLQGEHFRFMSDEQKGAIGTLLSSKFGGLTGGPGTGKTTCIRAICQTLQNAGRKVVLLAPSGKAAARITESTHMEAGTIHRVLFQMAAHMESFPTGAAILVDEASMVDSLLLAWLLTSMDNSHSLYLVGDVNQLPSVGPGRVFGDILESDMVPVGRLTRNFRTGGIEGIPNLARRILNGHLPDRDEENELWETGAKLVWFSPQEPASDWLDEMTAVVRNWQKIPDVEMKDIQVLSPTRKGPLGIYALNRHLRDILVPESEETVMDKDDIGPLSWRVGDRVIQLQNLYEGRTEPLFNGDMGEVVYVSERKIGVLFDKFNESRELAEYDASNIDTLQHAFAMTVHKSQGSEFKYTLLVVAPQHRFMLTNPLIYTGITRAQKELVILGSRKVMGNALGRDDNVRETCLYRFYAGFE